MQNGKNKPKSLGEEGSEVSVQMVSKTIRALKRKLERYVGADPTKITAALDAINRAHQFDRLAEGLAREEAKINAVEYQIDTATRATGNKLLLFATW